MKTGFIGCGNMGGILARAAAKAIGGENVTLYDPAKEKTEAIRAEYGCRITDLKTLAEECEVIFLGVKPQIMKEAAEELLPYLKARKDAPLIVSMAAGVLAEDVSSMLDGARVLRIMPNIPAGVGAGVIYYAVEGGATEADEACFREMMAETGMIVRIPEEKIDAGSAIASCGPAFICLVAEALTDAGIRLGFPPKDAEAYVLQMIYGTAKYALETGTHPANFRTAVCSPAGSTIEGITVLEKYGVRNSFLEAVKASHERSLELGK